MVLALAGDSTMTSGLPRGGPLRFFFFLPLLFFLAGFFVAFFLVAFFFVDFFAYALEPADLRLELFFEAASSGAFASVLFSAGSLMGAG